MNFSKNRHVFLILGLTLIYFASVSLEAVEILSDVPEAVTSETLQKRKLTLLEAYQLALKQSEAVALSVEEIHQARARFYRAFDYVLPRVDYIMSHTERDAPHNAAPAGGIGGDFTRSVTPENRFTFIQPLFSGFKEIAALQGSGADKKQQLLNWRRAKELLFIDVMDAYYAVLQAKRNVKTLKNSRQLGRDRLKELDERIKVGRSRETEKQTALADLRLVESDLVQAESLLKTSQQLLEFYIGESLEARVLVDEKIPFETFVPSEFEKKAEARADVQAAEQRYILAKKELFIARADLFPTITARGNYFTKRVGFQSGDDWDVAVELNIPVFEWGSIWGNIRAALATRESKRLLWQQARRSALLDIQNAFEDLDMAHLNAKALWRAKKASEKNYQLVASDYRVNLVNNLEVLDALRRLQDIELRSNEAHYQLKKSFWKFKVALGEVLEGVET
ncbi:MAG: TolC family protein [Chlamydiae bacterium]|nr:TolC family protein [Chlamydiota bacterium]MBI3267095.1 TolC family protein [Chlamydiota bacterium]